MQYETIRALIAAQGSKITSVEFIKKDGSYRKMLIQQAALPSRVKGDFACASAQAAAATRALNNPNLLNVFDMDRAAIRSIDMDTIFSIRSGGQLLFARPVGDAAVAWVDKAVL
jgi:hypothetical protein